MTSHDFKHTDDAQGGKCVMVTCEEEGCEFKTKSVMGTKSEVMEEHKGEKSDAESSGRKKERPAKRNGRREITAGEEYRRIPLCEKLPATCALFALSSLPPFYSHGMRRSDGTRQH